MLERRKKVVYLHTINGLDLRQNLEDGEGQEHLMHCSPRGHKESDKAFPLNNYKILIKWIFQCSGGVS